MNPTADLRVVHLAPHAGSSGVGDYADGFVAAIRPHVREVVEFRHGAPRTDTVRSVRAERRRLRELVASLQTRYAGEPLVVHCELSGGAVAPFWATRGLSRGLPGAVRITATLHDPPRPVWYPFLTRGVSRGRILNQAVHRPLHRLLERFERRSLRDVDLFVLTEAGTEATRSLRMGRSVTRARHVLPPAPTRAPVPASRRPAAIGLFGHVYTGKGFDLVPALRRTLPPGITLRVAGRGTENLAPAAGVDVLGPLEVGAELDAFFDSVQVLVMPYTRPRVGGLEMLPASGTHMVAMVHATPTVALASAATEELAREGLCEVVTGGADELVAAAARLAVSPDELDRRTAVLAVFLAEQRATGTAGPFLEVWGRTEAP
ncbi:MAG: hypothetical protein JWP74_2646 [Marmoricola sp.]|nr:hypothetical protein [Marmoricola sp.]